MTHIKATITNLQPHYAHYYLSFGLGFGIKFQSRTIIQGKYSEKKIHFTNFILNFPFLLLKKFGFSTLGLFYFPKLLLIQKNQKK